MRKIAFIPARSGSTRFPNKNITPLSGKPLIVWTVEAMVKSNCFDRIIFSSDSIEYYDILKSYINSDLLDFHERSKLEAGNKVKIFDYIKTNIDKWCSKEDIFSLALPTCPFRNEEHVRDCLELSIKTGKSIFSACEYDFHVPFAFYLDGLDNKSLWKPAFETSPMITGNTRSQDQINYFHPNGAIYVLKPNPFEKDPKTFYEDALPFIMSRVDSIDIDQKEDLQIAESIASSKAISNK